MRITRLNIFRRHKPKKDFKRCSGCLCIVSRISDGTFTHAINGHYARVYYPQDIADFWRPAEPDLATLWPIDSDWIEGISNKVFDCCTVEAKCDHEVY